MLEAIAKELVSPPDERVSVVVTGNSEVVDEAADEDDAPADSDPEDEEDGPAAPEEGIPAVDVIVPEEDESKDDWAETPVRAARKETVSKRPKLSEGGGTMVDVSSFFLRGVLEYTAQENREARI